MRTKKTSWSVVILPYMLVLLVWLFYRAFFHTSVWLEELVIKGLVFSLPMILFPLISSSGWRSMGISTKNFFQSVYLGILIGLLLGLVGQAGNFIRYGKFVFSSYGLSSGTVGAFIILSLITAFWEQLLFSGYLVSKIQEKTSDEFVQVVTVGLLFSIIHLPIYIFVQHMPIAEMGVSGILLLALGIGCTILRLRQENLMAPIMAQALWGITIFLFR